MDMWLVWRGYDCILPDPGENDVKKKLMKCREGNLVKKGCTLMATSSLML